MRRFEHYKNLKQKSRKVIMLVKPYSKKLLAVAIAAALSAPVMAAQVELDLSANFRGDFFNGSDLICHDRRA